MTQCYWKPSAGSPQRMPYLRREAAAPRAGQSLLGQGQPQDSREGNGSGSRNAPSVRAARAASPHRETPAAPFSPASRKLHVARSIFPPQERCEIFLKVSNSEGHFWSSQVLGGKLPHLWLRQSQSPMAHQGNLKSKQEFCQPAFTVRTPLNTSNSFTK